MRYFILVQFVFSSFLVCQQLDVTFRYVKDPNENFTSVFVPGTMPNGTSNDWGPNSNGLISPGALSQMTFSSSNDAYLKTYPLMIGDQHQYKLHFHYNSSGSDYSWIPDPVHPETTMDGYGNENSVLTVSDPLFFQPVRHLNNNGMVDGLSIGIFTNADIDSIRYKIGDDNFINDGYNLENGNFYVSFSPVRSLFESYKIEVSINGQIYNAYDQPEITITEQVRPDFVKEGPNWINGEMYLSIYAPSQPVIQVIVTDPGQAGSAADAFVLKRDPINEFLWWIKLELPNGQYDYEYLLLDGTRLPDPYSRRIVDGRTRIEIGPGGVSTSDDFNWESEDSYVRPDLNDLIIYELHVDDFAAMGNGLGKFDNIKSKLDYFQSLGINAIELMPITTIGGAHSWGYDLSNHLALNERYGSPYDLKSLVDQAHMRGIAVILDQVWNHVRAEGALYQIQKNYDLNPYLKPWTQTNINENQESWGMEDLDHFNLKTVEYVNNVNKIFLDEYKIDGFRFDAGRYIGWDLNQTEFGLNAWTDALYNHDNDVIQIIEYLPSDPWLTNALNISSSWHDSFHDKIKLDAHNNYNSTSDLMRQVIGLHEYSNISPPYQNRNQAIKYMISHDEQSLIQEMVVFDNFTMSQALERDKFYAAILFTSQGIPMLWQGQEFGFKSGWNDDNGNGDYDDEKLSYRPLDWSVLETEAGQNHFDHYKKLIMLRKNNSAFSKGEFYDLYRYSNQNVIVYGYKDESLEGDNDQVVVIANFSGSNQTIQNVPFLSSGNWYNFLEEGHDLYTSDGNYGEFQIDAKKAVIFTNKEQNLAIDEKVHPEKFQIFKAYPNPFNSSIDISFFTNEALNGSLDIFDITGRLVRSFEFDKINNGYISFKWNGYDNNLKEVPSGIYLIILKTDNFIVSNKISLIK